MDWIHDSSTYSRLNNNTSKLEKKTMHSRGVSALITFTPYTSRYDLIVLNICTIHTDGWYSLKLTSDKIFVLVDGLFVYIV